MAESGERGDAAGAGGGPGGSCRETAAGGRCPCGPPAPDNQEQQRRTERPQARPLFGRLSWACGLAERAPSFVIRGRRTDSPGGHLTGGGWAGEVRSRAGRAVCGERTGPSPAPWRGTESAPGRGGGAWRRVERPEAGGGRGRGGLPPEAQFAWGGPRRRRSGPRAGGSGARRPPGERRGAPPCGDGGAGREPTLRLRRRARQSPWGQPPGAEEGVGTAQCPGRRRRTSGRWAREPGPSVGAVALAFRPRRSLPGPGRVRPGS